MPFLKNNIYGCDNCSDEVTGSHILELAGSFTNKDYNMEIKIYGCPNCEAYYITINDNFIDGCFISNREE